MIISDGIFLLVDYFKSSFSNNMGKINPKPVTGYRLLVSEPSMNDDTSGFLKNISDVWDSRWMSNGGPKVLELEDKFRTKYNIPNIAIVVNGTVALQSAIRALNLPKGGNIITTPFTWMASTSSILWEGFKPRFVDINPYTLNIDASKIEEAIDEDTVAILAVHVFSNPCEIEKIQKIANRNDLKIIYDAAHAVGVNYKGKDVSLYGDVSIHSYHATKVYNMGEGGSVISTNKKLMERVYNIRNCGLNSNKEIVRIGTNAKIHEVTACIGLTNLEIVDDSIKHRRLLYKLYFDSLSHLIKDGRIRLQKFKPDSYNYSYFPVILESEKILLEVNELLKENLIMARRYFYPSLNELKWGHKQSCPISEDISKRILCLPSHDRVTDEDIKIISDIISSVVNRED
jgi:dTDP-4-amino-4,6-dideoxygalactose transaminase